VTTGDRLQRYAELVVRVGANVQHGQDVVVNCLVEHVEIARAVTR
jgi:leucyl aminopeptidase (aminopeptidase T)